MNEYHRAQSPQRACGREWEIQNSSGYQKQLALKPDGIDFREASSLLKLITALCTTACDLWPDFTLCAVEDWSAENYTEAWKSGGGCECDPLIQHYHGLAMLIWQLAISSQLLIEGLNAANQGVAFPFLETPSQSMSFPARQCRGKVRQQRQDFITLGTVPTQLTYLLRPIWLTT